MKCVTDSAGPQENATTCVEDQAADDSPDDNRRSDGCEAISNTILLPRPPGLLPRCYLVIAVFPRQRSRRGGPGDQTKTRGGVEA